MLKADVKAEVWCTCVTEVHGTPFKLAVQLGSHCSMLPLHLCHLSPQLCQQAVLLSLHLLHYTVFCLWHKSMHCLLRVRLMLARGATDVC